MKWLIIICVLILVGYFLRSLVNAYEQMMKEKKERSNADKKGGNND